jgi:hypothetical protein
VCGWWAPLVLSGLVATLAYVLEKKVGRDIALPFILVFCVALVAATFVEARLRAR